MKTKFILFSIVIAVVNYLIFLLAGYFGHPFYGLLISGMASLLLAILLYRWIIRPIEDLKSQLEQADEENSRSEKIRSEFVANVSHELKTPLTSIQGFLETLQEGAAENPEVRNKFLDIMAIETARLKRLIEDLLILSDIENRRNVSMEQQIQIQQSLQEIISSIMPIAQSRGIDVVLTVDPSLKIQGSEDRFKQMMLNLIENAIKYSRDGGVVRVSGELQSETEQILIQVRDQGIGISPEHIDRLFERFYRVEKSRSSKAGGTGLGLSIVKHIANLFEAELKVESQMNEGSVFSVLFPSQKRN
jgi:two-component system phosphate regulon sensor histidine kinase PhoR